MEWMSGQVHSPPRRKIKFLNEQVSIEQVVRIGRAQVRYGIHGDKDDFRASNSSDSLFSLFVQSCSPRELRFPKTRYRHRSLIGPPLKKKIVTVWRQTLWSVANKPSIVVQRADHVEIVREQYQRVSESDRVPRSLWNHRRAFPYGQPRSRQCEEPRPVRIPFAGLQSLILDGSGRLNRSGPRVLKLRTELDFDLKPVVRLVPAASITAYQMNTTIAGQFGPLDISTSRMSLCFIFE